MTTEQVVGVAAAPDDTDAVPEAGDAPATALLDNHRSLADYLRTWAAALQAEVGDDRRTPYDEADFLRGYVRALSDMAGHLSVGDALPGGPLHQRT